MTDNELDRLLREKLQKAGVQEVVDWEKFFLFPTPEGVLAEIVLTDASKLEQAERAVEEAKRELEGQRVSLLPTVRALWEVVSVEPEFDVASLPTLARQGIFSLRFRVKLKHAKEPVGVEVTPDAYRDLEYNKKCDIDTLKRVVEAWVKSRLLVGGADHWDPRRDRWRQIDAGGVSYVFAYRLVSVA